MDRLRIWGTEIDDGTIRQAELVEVLHTLHQVLNYKGT